MGTGEQDPGLPGFGVHLGEHSSNPGGKGKGRERVPDAWDTGEVGPRPAIQGSRMYGGRGGTSEVVKVRKSREMFVSITTCKLNSVIGCENVNRQSSAWENVRACMLRSS